jgi:hypothetical protein
VLCGSALIYSSISKRNAAWQKQKREAIKSAAILDKKSIMHGSDYIQLTEKGKVWRKTKGISDSDLAWCLSLLKHDPLVKKPGDEVMRQTLVLMFMRGIKDFTPTQRNMIYDFSRPLLSGDGGVLGNDYLMGMNFVRWTLDTRAISLLLPLTAHSNPKVKKAALDTIQDLREASSPK